MTREELLARLEEDGNWTITDGQEVEVKPENNKTYKLIVDGYDPPEIYARYCGDDGWEQGLWRPTNPEEAYIYEQEVLAYRQEYDPDNEWVPVESGQLPPYDKMVLLQLEDGKEVTWQTAYLHKKVSTNGDDYFYGRYSDYNLLDQEHRHMSCVKAWRNLPPKFERP